MLRTVASVACLASIETPVPAIASPSISAVKPRSRLAPLRQELIEAKRAVGECSYPELAERFDAIYARWLAQKTKDGAWRDEFDMRLAAATGRPLGERLDPSDPDWTEYEEAFSVVWDETPDPDPIDEHGASIAWNEIDDVLYPLLDEIARHPALSLVDLAFKARAVALADYTVWTKGASMERIDIGAIAVRSLVDDICRLTGVDVLPGLDIVPFEECLTDE